MIRATKRHRKWLKYLTEVSSEGYWYEILNHKFFIDWEQGEKTSFSSISILTGENEGLAYLSFCNVLPEYRGLGLQRRHLIARLRYAKKLGCTEVITYTKAWNIYSNNNLILLGFTMYKPICKYAGANMLYWRKEI